MSPVLRVIGVDESMRPIADGVGVTGGGLEGDSLLGFRLLAGVVGSLNGLVVVDDISSVFATLSEDPFAGFVLLGVSDCVPRPRFLDVAGVVEAGNTGTTESRAFTRVDRRRLISLEYCILVQVCTASVFVVVRLYIPESIRRRRLLYRKWQDD